MRHWSKAVRFEMVLMLVAGGVAAASAGEPASPGKSGGSGQQIYGTILTDGGKHYTGVIRWGDEEAFWDDLFNSSKDELPYIDRLPESERPRVSIKILGFLPIGYTEENGQGRQFVARFGDIKAIDPLGSGSVAVEMKDGTKYSLSGGSNDIGTDIRIEDGEAGGVDLKWRNIEAIRFGPDPAGAPEPSARRLYGEVTTGAGTFTGFIQWDSQECLTTDLLDGDTQKGRVSLEMGSIRTIEKTDDNGVRVETTDGASLVLHGTNDVNSSIRGILVEDPRYGRVKISWGAFTRLDLREARSAGRGYGDYPPPRRLQGRVTDVEGKSWQGIIVYDLDESETFEMLDGSLKGVDYSIPFERIASIQPKANRTAVITLRNGQTLRLGESQDVSDRNSGVLLIMKADGADQERYLPWSSIAKIELD